MSKRKSEEELVRFSWKRNPQYDYLLLLEVESRNPFSFKKPKPIWEEIAKALQGGDLKMKVNERGCRDRVTQLLKKHRKDESDSSRATGVSEEEMSHLKKLLTSVDQIEQTKPNKKDSSLYLEKSKGEADAIRAAALRDLSDSDENNLDDDEVYSNNLFSDAPMSLQEEYMIDQESLRELKQASHDQDQSSLSDGDDQSPLSEQNQLSREQHQSLLSKDNQSLLSGDNRSPLSEHHQLSREQYQSLSKNNRSSLRNNQNYVQKENSLSKHQNVADDTSDDSDYGEYSAPQQSKRKNNLSRKNTNPRKSSKHTPSPTSSNSFKNPKKDLVNYLEKKSQSEIELRRDEIRIREFEADIKRTEIMEQARIREIEAQNKKEELQILRAKTEAETEERKKINDLLIQLVTKNQSN